MGVSSTALAGARVESGVGDPLFGFEVFGHDEQFAEQTQGADFADARHAAEPLDLAGEIGLVCGQCGSGLLKGFDPLFQLAAELNEPPVELLQGQDGVRRVASRARTPCAGGTRGCREHRLGRSWRG